MPFLRSARGKRILAVVAGAVSMTALILVALFASMNGHFAHADGGGPTPTPPPAPTATAAPAATATTAPAATATTAAVATATTAPAPAATPTASGTGSNPFAGFISAIQNNCLLALLILLALILLVLAIIFLVSRRNRNDQPVVNNRSGN